MALSIQGTVPSARPSPAPRSLLPHKRRWRATSDVCTLFLGPPLPGGAVSKWNKRTETPLPFSESLPPCCAQKLIASKGWHFSAGPKEPCLRPAPSMCLAAKNSCVIWTSHFLSPDKVSPRRGEGMRSPRPLPSQRAYARPSPSQGRKQPQSHEVNFPSSPSPSSGEVRATLSPSVPSVRRWA